MKVRGDFLGPPRSTDKTTLKANRSYHLASPTVTNINDKDYNVQS